METKDKLYCVYKHTSPSGKVYVGITCQIPEKRWANGNGYKSNKYFFSAIKKYGWDKFIHEILFDQLSYDVACQKEIELIAYYDSTNPHKGYNLSTGGENGGSGYHMSEEAKQKISKANKGRVVSEETKRKMVENHRDMSGPNNPNYGKPRSDDVKRKLREAHLGRPSNRKGIPHTEESKRKISEARIGRFCGEDNPNYGNHKLAGENNPLYGSGLAVVQFDKMGNRIAEYISALFAEKATGIAQANIRKCCKGEIYSIGGFMWRFLKDAPQGNIEPYKNPKWTPVVQLDLDNNIIQAFKNMNDASVSADVPPSNISACCRGLTPSAGGFHWMYKEDYEKQIKNLNND